MLALYNAVKQMCSYISVSYVMAKIVQCVHAHFLSRTKNWFELDNRIQWCLLLMILTVMFH